jgi:hypothetical protein
MVLLCQWLCHLCGELWYHTRAEGFTYVSFTHTQGFVYNPVVSLAPGSSCKFNFCIVCEAAVDTYTYFLLLAKCVLHSSDNDNPSHNVLA